MYQQASYAISDRATRPATECHTVTLLCTVLSIEAFPVARGFSSRMLLRSHRLRHCVVRERCIVMTAPACLSVCLPAYVKNHSTKLQIFCACCQCGVALRYISGFVDDVIFTDMPGKGDACRASVCCKWRRAEYDGLCCSVCGDWWWLHVRLSTDGPATYHAPVHRDQPQGACVRASTCYLLYS